ncbi:MAG: CocE/NonD family hydrolase [SAR324 cluster bacterium]|nr:CocE/NonD family hydrolase [SAR324 cluster bacterium]MEC9383786.1 CocE/NonD family hydrolase [SAR324 cluster bacterium]
MKIKTEFPYKTRIIRHCWINMPDGCRLSARIWLPDNAEKEPVPAIMEYIPYRKNDGTALRDSLYHPYFAGHGYAAIRVDMRGSGDSEGVMLDEYLAQELDDAVSVIDWLVQQSWCNGKVGMMGKSWGGFNSLEVAALKPPALKSIITVCSSDDRYADDVHYKGGCVLSTDMLGWSTTMLAWNARPPDPAVLGENWRDLWMERLEQTPLLVQEWIRHQQRDTYWKHGSICEDYSAIECAVYAVGGWADPYSNAIPRMLAGLSCPRKGLIGPWAHEYPQRALPGPQIGFAQECLRWWDFWLKGTETAIMEEPMLRVWMPKSVAPKTYHEFRPGHWVGEALWPSENSEVQTWYLNRNGLNQSLETEKAMLFPTSQVVGLNAGVWFPMGAAGDFPGDQRSADSGSLCFTSEVFEDGMEILGNPEVIVSLNCDKPKALLAARLCDVAPDGTSLLVSWGLLNLTHRNGHENPEELIPGKKFKAKVQLNACAHALSPGHRWRVSLSSAYFPHAWPSPELTTLQIFPGDETFLNLPFRKSRPEDAQLTDFLDPECSPPVPTEELRTSSRKRTIEHEVIEDRITLTDKVDNGRYRFVEDGLETEDVGCDTLSLKEGEPLSLKVNCERKAGIGRGDWQTRVEASGTMTASLENFEVISRLEVFEGGQRIFYRTWDFQIPRGWV